MSRLRRALIVVVIVAAVVLLSVGLLRPARSVGSGAQLGQQAPLFESTDLSGQPVALKDFRGHRVVLNFWASTCVPCRAEFPVLKRLKAEHPDVIVLGVVFNDDDGSARQFMASEAATWPGVRDPHLQIANAYGVHAKPGIPVSVLIDPAGRVKERRLGPLTDDAAAAAFIGEASVA